MKGSVDRRLIVATELMVTAEEMKQQKVDSRRRTKRMAIGDGYVWYNSDVMITL